MIYDGVKRGNTLISGVGSALVDILAHVTEDELSNVGAARGGMTLVDMTYIADALTKIASDTVQVPGGAACNSIIGVASMGGNARFVGKCGRDAFGEFFSEAVGKSGVDAKLELSETPTGRVLSMITPDAQRTMTTCLGAAQELDPSEITEKSFAGSSIVLIEGYLLFNGDLMRSAIDQAKASGAKIALDLASFTVVDACKDVLVDIVKNDVDILIANEDEAAAYTGCSDEMNALADMAENVDIAVLKVGSRGSRIAYKGQTISVPPATGGGDVVDTTGAGDLWAAGFLYGVVNQFSLINSGCIGSACGYEVCQVLGAHIPAEGWGRIKSMIEEIRSAES